MKHPPDGDRGLAADREGLAWQIRVWDRISQIYLREIDKRFEPVVEQLFARAALAPGQYVLDLGTGTAALIELIKMRASRINGCAFCIDKHWKDGRAQGESEQRLYALSA